jgi:hypothetical protein
MRHEIVQFAMWGLLAVLVAGGPEPVRADSPAPAANDFFESKVRPVLVESCLACHGARKQSSGLRVDSREALLEGGESGPAIVPSDPDKSLLIQAIRHTHDEIRMPPKTKLAEPAVEALSSWVRHGAPWPKDAVLSEKARENAAETHWAFQALRDAKPPEVKQTSWPVSPVDAFILAKLESRGMTPAPRADRRTLIRRASFDLTGLPPTFEEIAAFETDPRPDAFEQVVDRLLASPRYGERWGRHWLDVARYADTKGYVFNEDRRYPYAFTYRDYVVRAFNDDLPYDQFLIQQLAADRLDLKDDRRSLAALGFLTVGRRFLNDGNDIIDDRIDVVCRGIMGLTVACARCHDHKYDPIPTEDYYSLYGVFASTVEPTELPTIPSPASESQRRDFDKQRAAAQAEIETFVGRKLDDVATDLRSRIVPYLRAAAELRFDPGSAKLAERARADGLRAGHLSFLIERWKSYVEKAGKRHDPVFQPWVELVGLKADEFPSKAVETLERLKTSNSPPNSAVIEALRSSPPTDAVQLASRYADLFAKAETKWKTASARGAIQSLPEPEWEAIRQVLNGADGLLAFAATRKTVAGDPGSEISRRLLTAGDRDRLTALRTKLADITRSHPGAPLHAMAVEDARHPFDPHVFVRGNPGRAGKPVPRRFLRVLSGADRTPFRQGSGRLELARAIASPSNPLTARVLVNRIWLEHFGVGLVDTPSDFGVRSQKPNHPELLDFLALGFIRSGWSIKALHRQLLHSSTYQQSSDNPHLYAEQDSENRLLSRFPRRRLDFEAMRDAVLFVSAQLDTTMGGRSTEINVAPFPPRRTIYGLIDRQNLDDVYRTFDFASPDATSPRRFVTTVPQQSLFLMNSPFMAEQSRRTAEGLDLSTSRESRIRALYERILGRTPTPDEVALGLRLVATSERPDAPERFSRWAQYAQVLLMSNEFLFVD